MGCPATKTTRSPDLRRPASIAERSIRAIISSVEAIKGATIGKTPLATVNWRATCSEDVKATTGIAGR